VWGGDGRITAGHLAVLAERAAAGPLDLILFDGAAGAGWRRRFPPAAAMTTIDWCHSACHCRGN
jgi:hypothetical protein